MTFFLNALVLALIWSAITNSFTLHNLLLGGLIGFGALWFIRERITGPALLTRIGRIIGLALLFFYELLLSAVRVAWLVIQPNLRTQLQPGIIAFPLTAKSDREITLLANLITLTPGTLSVDVSEDRRYIYVHAISVPDKQELIRSIAEGFEAKIIEVFR